MAKIAVVRQFWAFLRERKKWWLLPIVLVLVLIGAVVTAASGTALAPFVYALF